MPRRPFVLVLSALLLLTAASATPVVKRSEPTPDAYVSITVIGLYADLVLVDPAGRASFITPAGRESTFKGCQRVDVPDVGGIPDSLDYTRFYVREPLTGLYRLTMTARKPASIRVDALGAWSDSGHGRSVGDNGGLGAMSGDKVTCAVSVRRGMSHGKDTLSIMIAELRKSRPK